MADVPGAEEAAAGTDVPLLWSPPSRDPGVGRDVLRRAVKGSPAAPKRFIYAPDGHRWSMLHVGSTAAPEWRRSRARAGVGRGDTA